jgi:hypothetical protein
MQAISKRSNLCQYQGRQTVGSTSLLHLAQRIGGGPGLPCKHLVCLSVDPTPAKPL